MSEIKIPTVGRQVYYYPNGGDPHCAANNAEVLPATVIQPFGTRINVVVLCMNGDGLIVSRFSVPHKSEIAANVVAPYWDWPEIK